MDRFTLSEMREFASMVEDEPINTTIHKHHCKNGRGNDRLYITKNETGVVAFCHHCGKKGGVSQYLPNLARKRNTKAATARISKKLPSGITSPREWPVEALKWPLSAKLTFAEIEEEGFLWCPSIGRVVLPIMNNGYQGYIARLVEGDGPKYLASVSDKSKFVFHKLVNPDSQTCVIVEDVLSAIRLARSGYNAIALLGTSLTDEVLNTLLYNKYNKFIIWMDNDNPQVKMNQIKVRNTLSPYGDVSIIKTSTDPKTHSKSQIDKLIGDIVCQYV